MKQKTFYNALMEASLSPEKAKKCLLDKRLTNSEKKIFEGFLLIRNNRNSEGTILLKSLSVSCFPFVEAQRNLLIGLSLNNQSYFIEAEEFLWKAIPAFKELDSHYFQFMGYFNLCMICLATNQLQKMPALIQQMESITIENKVQILRLLRCKFNYFTEVNDKENALEMLCNLEPLKATMPESDIISHLVCEFMFFVTLEDFTKCKTILVEMKKYRKFHLTENFNFMKLMLNHLTSNSPIYLSGGEFATVPILFHQLKLIHAFEENNEAEALLHWSRLEAILPDVFKNNFHYDGTKCLFSLCLKKHLVSRAAPLTVIKDESLNYLDILLNLLVSSPGPLSKSYVYEFVWGDLPKDKDDLRRLSRLISRIRTEKGIEISSRKGTYFLEKSVKKIKIA